jgi:hypothetical protein
MFVNSDRRISVWVQSNDLPWLLSPEPGVERRLLERSGGEVATATSIVRYSAGSRFAEHCHPLGEEFLVLKGVFSDEHGDYPEGTYVRNPPGTRHSPFSRGGCEILVKLRQMNPDDRGFVCVLPHQTQWEHTHADGLMRAMLWQDKVSSVSLERIDPGAKRPACASPGGEEWFLLAGNVQRKGDEGTEGERMFAGTWLRDPGISQSELSSEEGALLWVKRGHLGILQPAGEHYERT